MDEIIKNIIQNINPWKLSWDNIDDTNCYAWALGIDLSSQELEWNTHTLYYNFRDKCTELGVEILDPRINSYIKLSPYSELFIYNSDSTNFTDYNHQSLILLYKYKNNNQ